MSESKGFYEIGSTGNGYLVTYHTCERGGFIHRQGDQGTVVASVKTLEEAEKIVNAATGRKAAMAEQSLFPFGHMTWEDADNGLCITAPAPENFGPGHYVGRPTPTVQTWHPPTTRVVSVALLQKVHDLIARHEYYDDEVDAALFEIDAIIKLSPL